MPEVMESDALQPSGLQQVPPCRAPALLVPRDVESTLAFQRITVLDVLREISGKQEVIRGCYAEQLGPLIELGCGRQGGIVQLQQPRAAVRLRALAGYAYA